MIDRIVSIGCSHMYGSEIYGPDTLDYATPESRALTFAGHVAKEFDLLHIDFSTPGGSNTHIRETAIEWIAEQGSRPRNTLFLIGWTESTRFEYWDDLNNEYKKIKNPSIKDLIQLSKKFNISYIY